MEAVDLQNLAEAYAANKSYITNEEATKMALIAPFLKLLGYDTNNPREVRPEYSAPFTENDGKRYPDRMDYAIFDATGERPMLVIEAKPLSDDLSKRSPQLGRYISQLSGLHFGILTNGCTYQFFGDLLEQNKMDPDPFFSFSLADEREDWQKVATFLAKFSRSEFNAETLVTDAENSRYRRKMVARLAAALKSPAEDEHFMRWLCMEVYDGRLTKTAFERLSMIAAECIEPAIMRVMGRSIAERIQARFDEVEKDTSGNVTTEVAQDQEADGRAIETTDEELQLHRTVTSICEQAGFDASLVFPKDTTNYFNISYRRKTKWFLRFFGDSKRKAFVTHVPVERVRELAPSFEVEESPPVFGVSRIFITEIGQAWALKGVILESLRIMLGEDAV